MVKNRRIQTGIDIEIIKTSRSDKSRYDAP